MTTENKENFSNNRKVSENDSKEEDRDTQKDRFLTFYLEKEVYGIDIRYVTEIIGVQDITKIPNMENFINGVTNLRGVIIPIIDVRIRFGFKPRKYDDRTCIIIVNINEIAIGLLVDSVSKVINIPLENIEPPAYTGRDEKSRYIKALGKVNDEVKIIIDLDRFFIKEELKKIEEMISVRA